MRGAVVSGEGAGLGACISAVFKADGEPEKRAGGSDMSGQSRVKRYI